MSQRLGQINEQLRKQLESRRDNSNGPSGSLDEQVSAFAKAFQDAKAKERSGAADISVAEFNQYYVLTAYTSIHQKVSERMRQIYNAVDAMRDFYLVEVMLGQLTEDALAPKIGSEEIVKFSHKDPKVMEFINDMKNRVGLDQMIENITPDLCCYGDYVLETDVRPGIGINGIYDNLEQGFTVPLIQDGESRGYLFVDEVQKTIEKRELADFIHFSLGGQRIKVRFDESIPLLVKSNKKIEDYFRRTPKYIRVGRSILYPVLGKLRELELLEKLIPASKINKLSQGNTIGIPVPADYDLERGFNAAKQIENNINRRVMVDQTMKEITVEAILSTAGRSKVIPVFGDKGRLEKLDYKGDEADDLFSNTKDLRELICDSIGIPSEIVFKSNDTGGNKDILKRYAKYLRKLKKIQKAIIEGCRQIIAIHLANSEHFQHIDPNSVDIILNNHLIEIDNLDRLEHADITISFMKNVKEFFDELTTEGSVYKPYVKISSVIQFIEDQLKTIGLADAIETSQEKVQSGEMTDDEADKLDDQVQGDDAAANPADGEDDVEEESEYPDLPFDPTKPPKNETQARRRVTEKRTQRKGSKKVAKKAARKGKR